MSIPIDLSSHLSTKTTQCILRLGEEFGVDPETGPGLAWLMFVMRSIKDTTYNFPTGKYNTIMAIEGILNDYASRHAAIFYNGRV